MSNEIHPTFVLNENLTKQRNGFQRSNFSSFLVPVIVIVVYIYLTDLEPLYKHQGHCPIGYFQMRAHTPYAPAPPYYRGSNNLR